MSRAPVIGSGLGGFAAAMQLRAKGYEVVDFCWSLGGPAESLIGDDCRHILTDCVSLAGTGVSLAPHVTKSGGFRGHHKAEGPENLSLIDAGIQPSAGLGDTISRAKVLEHLVPHAMRPPAEATLQFAGPI